MMFVAQLDNSDFFAMQVESGDFGKYKGAYDGAYYTFLCPDCQITTTLAQCT